MTIRKASVLSLIFLLSLTVAGTVWGQGGEKLIGKFFQATDVFVRPVDPGKVTPDPAGLRLRGAINVYHIEASDARVSGDYTITLNANWDLAYAGPAWGTFSCDRPDGGQWSGVFYGWRYRVSDTEWEAVFQEFGYGSAGDIAGLRFKSIEIVHSTQTSFRGDISGRIFTGDSE